jgi:hypothetical protein
MSKNRLIDVADVRHGNGDWMRGKEERNGLETSVEVFLVDPCELDAEVSLLAGGDPSIYSVTPFGIEFVLNMPVNCTPAEAESWLSKALGDANEYILTRALVTEQVSGTENWVGATGSTQFTLTGTPTTAALVLGARAFWLSRILSTDNFRPIMHVSPAAVPVLLAENLLTLNYNSTGSIGVASPLGDDVVVGDGYGSGPQVFFTGPITINISTPELIEGQPINPRNNRVQIAATQLAAIDLSPRNVVSIATLPI